MIDSLSAAVADLEPELVEFRRDLHRNPEPSWQEVRTTRVVADRLTAAGLRLEKIDQTGVYADLGATDPIVRVGLRADMDALPLTEHTGLEFASRRKGTAHACGHDVHTTALLGATLALVAHEDALRDAGIGVRVIFQPAEESMPGGAKVVLDKGLVDALEIVFAVHCDPRRDVGEIGLRVGPITAAADQVTVRLSGHGGHTSRPFLTEDLTFALGKVMTDLPGAMSRRMDPRTGALLVWGGVHAGGVPNVIPDSGEVTGTLRMLDASAWQGVGPLLEQLVDAVVAPYGVEAELRHVPGVPPVVNTQWGFDALSLATTGFLGASAVGPAEQSLGGEDFAWLVMNREGALARLGTRTPGGPTHDLHRGDLVVDERAIGIGARLYASAPFTALATRMSTAPSF
ncbi:amidohydrolase [Mobilicoccus pelagius]|uniref:Peptidase M20 family protein n=1 Tax=Mobilicoccus pelagius NBRC 104925 TaxID=1089455 RepID=H5UU12_9MICO|nr:amidohydrolase [Mobilicoccus pelagius]GAB49220.1 peptidase M20 family protein [Mobilicoccus pelagius NBRC 104925]